jgi:hypothetical protein
MPKLDLRTLLTSSLVANSNEPIRADSPDRTDEAAALEAPPSTATPASPRDSPRARRGHTRAPGPQPSPAARTHRALRPRRRS